ncbi:MAG: magnesium/cobalt efflux protein [Flavobacteriaceae bacterium]|jgi:Mg2+/Co2+ transporter CorB|nr:magnesium/cobalt efflux protein [Flavobacteriaceae bacterium]|tara:strand:+ start:355 stop:1617 length:1263 start_codon:yes stop_codon:yes gene_type:complete
MLLSSIFILLCLSAFFSSSETGMMALNRFKLKHLIKQKNKSAIRASKLLQRPDRLLGIILIGNNFVNILAASLTTILCLKLFGNSGVFIGSIILTMVILIFAEVTPKTFAANNPEKIALPSSLILKMLQKLLYPLVWIVNFLSNSLLKILKIDGKTPDEDISPEELKSILENSGDLIPSRYQEMLLSILELDKISVDEIMIPRNEIIGIDLSDDIKDVMSQLKNSKKEFLPLFDQNLDETKGIIDLYGINSFLSEENKSIENLLDKSDQVYFALENTSLNIQLFNFQKDKKTIAIVLDEYGSVKGILTIKDILEEIVGQLSDPHEEERVEIKEQKDGGYLIDASVSVREINRKLDWNLPLSGPKTLNGLILENTETIPEANISIEIEGYLIETVLIKDNMIKFAKVLKLLSQDHDEEALD